MRRYTGIGDNRDIQSNNYRYRVNLVCDDTPVLAITTIFKMNRILMITLHVNTPAPVLGCDLQVAVLRLNPDTDVKQEDDAALAATQRRAVFIRVSCHYFTSHRMGNVTLTC